MNAELTKENLKKIYGKVSPFEFKDKLLNLARLNNNTIMVSLHLDGDYEFLLQI